MDRPGFTERSGARLRRPPSETTETRSRPHRRGSRARARARARAHDAPARGVSWTRCAPTRSQGSRVQPRCERLSPPPRRGRRGRLGPVSVDHDARWRGATAPFACRPARADANGRVRDANGCVRIASFARSPSRSRRVRIQGARPKCVRTNHANGPVSPGGRSRRTRTLFARVRNDRRDVPITGLGGWTSCASRSAAPSSRGAT